MGERRIAVVGAGIAGLGAAWSLHRAGFDVTVYEADDRVGGHAMTLDVDDGFGRTSFDAGVQAICPRLYPNTLALARLLGVRPVPVPHGFTVESPDGGICGINHHHTDLWREVEPECVRFTIEMEDLVTLKSVEVISCSIGDYLRSRGYSERFIWLIDSLGALIGQENDHDMDTTMLFYAMGITSGLLSLFMAAPLALTFDGGMRALVEAVAAPLGDRVRLSRGVRGVRREGGAAVVTDARGEVARYDDVIFAVDGLLALEMIEDPSPLEENLLGGCQIQRYPAIVHGDRSVLLRGIDEADRTAVEVSAAQVVTFNVEEFQHRKRGAPLLITYSDAATIDPARVHRRIEVRTGKDNTYSFELKRNLHRIQGADRLWFAGEWTTLSIMEHALLSGLIVAQAMGAPYPFAADHRASKMHEVMRAMMLEGRESFSLAD